MINSELWLPICKIIENIYYLTQEAPLEKEMATPSVLLPGKSHGWRNLVGYNPWGSKELDTTVQLYSLFSHL